MHFHHIWLRNVKDVFTWHSEKPVPAGARVTVKFRGRERIGIVVGHQIETPEFKTQPILDVWEEDFIDERWMEIASNLAQNTFSPLSKIMSLMVPEKFCHQRRPETRDVFYQFPEGCDVEKIKSELRGQKQILALELIQKSGGMIASEKLRKDIGLPTIKSLLEKNIIIEKVGRVSTKEKLSHKNVHDLTSTQKKALESIQKDKRPTLLFGVTGSGKTEIYKHLVASTSGNIMLLVPEIALTPQLIDDFINVIGDELVVWHSKLSEGEKIQAWARLASGEARMIIGTRSAALVPIRNVELIIMDEEHEWTYKNEFAPRFWAHDVALNVAQKFCSKIVLGSATPRLESLVACEKGDWQRVDLPERVSQVQMPEIELVDLKNEATKGNYSPLSESLLHELQQTLKNGKQAMLFLNKRGYAGATMCKCCGHKFECPHCSFNMKLHGFRGKVAKFVCHICGHLEGFTNTCPECGTEDFQLRGWGTQQVEEALKKHFPEIRILRADADSVTGKHDFEKILQTFHAGEADILLGTQMIAKGLDFENVHLVGIVLADVGLSLPDFRSEERVFQLLTQVSGRAGRRTDRGKIVLQTFAPDEPLFNFVKTYDTEGFLNYQKQQREETGMPPFSVIAKLTISNADKGKAFDIGKRLYRKIQSSPFWGELEGGPDEKTLPPAPSQREGESTHWKCHFAPAFFPRTHGKYHFHVFVHAADRDSIFKILSQVEMPNGVKIDVAPSSLL